MKSLLSTMTTLLQTGAAHAETLGPGDLVAGRPPEAAGAVTAGSYPRHYRFES